MPLPLVTIQLVVHNAASWLKRSLDSIAAQTYPHDHVEISILNNDSSDHTADIIKGFGFRISDFGFARFSPVITAENLGFWTGQEQLLKHAAGAYIIAMTDVELDPHFIERAVAVFAEDEHIGAVQAKVLQHRASSGQPPFIDTTGFQIFKSRRIINRGHGQQDKGQFDKQEEIFGVEGAVPVFQREALENIRIENHIVDPDFHVGPYGYGDDLDIAWRLRLFGWKQIYAPGVIAYHDRSTTRNAARRWYESGGRSRRAQRENVPLAIRRLDWSNVRFTIIKNDYIINILRDFLRILIREIATLGYMLIFEPGVLAEVGRFFRLLPRMRRRRKIVMQHARCTARGMRKWFT